jgi:hypothetical protein
MTEKKVKAVRPRLEALMAQDRDLRKGSCPRLNGRTGFDREDNG